jgi:hypothetical protein
LLDGKRDELCRKKKKKETCCIADMEAVAVEARQGERAYERPSQRVVALSNRGLVGSIEV